MKVVEQPTEADVGELVTIVNKALDAECMTVSRYEGEFAKTWATLRAWLAARGVDVPELVIH